jgi:hypothetical protein
MNIKSSTLSSLYPSYISIQTKINKIVSEKINDFKIIYTYTIFDKKQEITTLINNMLDEKPLLLIVHEKILPNLKLDSRFIENNKEIIATKGIWGYINGIRVQCYNTNLRLNESFIFIITEKQQNNVGIRIFHRSKTCH